MNTTILEKRVSESILFDFDCAPNLSAAETITSAGPATADQGGFTFGSPTVNTSIVTYPGGTTAPVGTVAQVRITGGVIPAGSVLPDGRRGIRCTIRLPHVTSIGNTREATVLLDLTDTPA